LPSGRAQPDLFNEPRLPAALRYVPDLISLAEEDALVPQMKKLPFKEFGFHGFFGKRRVVSFGWALRQRTNAGLVPARAE